MPVLLQQFCYCLFKVNKQTTTQKKKYIQKKKKARLFFFLHVMAEALGSCKHALLLLRDITQHQSAVTKSCTESIKG